MSKKYILITSLILFCNLIFSQKIKHNSNNVDLIPYRIGHKWGFSNSNGELKMPTIYSEVKFFNKYGLAHVATGGPNRTDLSFGYIDTLGNEVVPIKQYEYLHDFVDSLARADLKNKKYCVFDLQGNKVINDTNISLKVLQNGLIATFNKGYVGLINRQGNKILDSEFLAISDFVQGVALIKNKEEKYGIINENGSLQTSIVYDKIYQDDTYSLMRYNNNMDSNILSKGLIPAKMSLNDSLSKWGVIDLNGNVIIPFLYDYMGFFTKGLALVGEYYDGKKMKWGVVDKKGKLVLPIKYNGLDNFKYGASYTYIDNKAGFINLKGEKISEFKYDYASEFVNGFAMVGITKEKPNTGRYWSFVNRKGEEITKRYYDKVKDFRDGLASVELNGKYGLIDTLGQEVIPLNYKSVINFEDYIIASEDGQFWGIIDNSNNVLIPFKYNLIAPVSEKENLFQIMIFDYKTGQTKEGFVDINGTEYFED